MKKALIAAAAVVMLLALGACVAGSGESAHSAESGLLAQFFLGLWHGIIAPFILIVEVVNRIRPHTLPWAVHIYETKAEGAPYDVGFYLGLVGGPSFAWTRRPQ